MTGATICSGILAPESAMPWIDWKWTAEIDAFPKAVIKAKTRAPNLGDVTAADFIERAAAHGPLDLLVAGTPCQSFSMAGLRKSLKDGRGNITLRLVQIVHANRPRLLLWENVPGVLSTHDNAFGCLLGGLVGADSAVKCSTGWTSAGVVAGPIGSAAWRILDAQYFGLAQRRARVFLAFSFGAGPDPAEILFEFESLRRDHPPSREAGQITSGTLSARTEGGGGLGTDLDLGGGLVPEISFALNAGACARNDAESETLIAASGGSSRTYVGVRRLMPVECCRLQGFPADYFDGVLYRNKPPADGPMYKALGNSMAVPVLAWIGERIRKAIGVL